MVFLYTTVNNIGKINAWTVGLCRFYDAEEALCKVEALFLYAVLLKVRPDHLQDKIC